MKLLGSIVAALGVFFLSMSVAYAAQQTAHQTVEQTTQRVMTLIKEANQYFDQDPGRFYREIEQILDEVVDFSSFSRGVMGAYATKEYYKQLGSDEAKQEFREQVKLFSKVFRAGLVQTYAKGLLAFGGIRIEVVPPEQASPKSSITVMQKIYGSAEKPYEVLYTMRKNKAGAWKMRNVTIEAVNLGRVYQGQFSSAAKQYGGDLNKVIDNWTITPVENKSAE